MHKVFISFHHDNDQKYKDWLVKWAEENDVFIDASVDMDEIPEAWDDQRIREYIRDEHLKDSTVTILLVGTETKNRKHVDWELYSSMHDGKVNKKSGIIVILLPGVESEFCICSHNNEKDFFPDRKWTSVHSQKEYNECYPYIPERIIDNLLASNVYISVINWSDMTPDLLTRMIDNAYNSRANCDYDLSKPMRRRNG